MPSGLLNVKPPVDKIHNKQYCQIENRKISDFSRLPVHYYGLASGASPAYSKILIGWGGRAQNRVAGPPESCRKLSKYQLATHISIAYSAIVITTVAYKHIK